MTRKEFLIGAISVCAIIGVWQLVATIFASPFILPYPFPVLLDSLSLIGDSAFRAMLAATCLRGIIAFAFSLILALILGLASGIFPAFATALKPWMTAVKATPVVSIILIALLWFGSSIVPVFVAILMTLPVMTEAIAQGVKNCDVKLLEMARVYQFSARDVIVHIRLPSSLPFLLAGAGSSLGLTWKVVVAGEILSSPRYGLGSAMQTAKVHLETSRVFSLTIAAILLSVATELVFDLLVSLATRHAGRK